MTTLTLRSFDATTATFDVTIDLGNEANARWWGSYVVDRATGAERSMSMTVDRVTIETQTTIEDPR